MGLDKLPLILMLLTSVMLKTPIKDNITYLDISIIEDVTEIENIIKNELIDANEDNVNHKEEIAVEIGIIPFDVNGLILREGIANEEVLRIKKFLKEKGYNNINEDYYFDNYTKEVVMNYQNINGLSPDGIIGKNTFEKINNDMRISKISIPMINLLFTKDIPKNNWIIINKSSNTLYHLKGEVVIERYPVATGKSPEYTPEGQFTIVTKLINPYWGGAGKFTPVKGGAPNNPLGKRWMGLSIKGGGSYGIHGNADESSVGKYISLGCIRMFNKDVEHLYELINQGTIVKIGTEAKLKEFGILFNNTP